MTEQYTDSHLSTRAPETVPQLTVADLTVVIPVAPWDSLPQLLLAQLAEQGATQIILSGAHACPTELPSTTRWITGAAGRAEQLNLGAAQVVTSAVLFLHADSSLCKNFVAQFLRALAQYPSALHFGQLRFSGKGALPMLLNEWGARFRSRVLQLPFGDQGFGLMSEQFRKIGGFPRGENRGEDLLFVRSCWRSKIPVRELAATVTTSARRYVQNGWLKTTLLHLRETARLLRRPPTPYGSNCTRDIR